MLKFLYLLARPESNKIFIKLINKIIAKIANLIMPIVYKCFNKELGIQDDNNVVVSLTSYPDRINKIWITIESLLRQSSKPKKIILWLAESQFPEKTKSLPKDLLKLQKRGLTIKFCEDIKSFKKFIYTAKIYNNYIIITADDDVIYPNDWIEKLLKEHVVNPNCVCCYRAHPIRLNDNMRPKKYKDWDFTSNGVKGPSHLLIATGVGGILYPPNFFTKEMLDINLIQKLCPLADDIWLKVMELINDYKVVKVDDRCKHWFPSFFQIRS